MAFSSGSLLCSLHCMFAQAATVAGKAYFVSGAPATTTTVNHTIAKYSGAGLQPVPAFVKSILLVCFDAQHALKGLLGLQRPALSTSAFIRMAAVQKTFNNDKAHRELGWKPLCSIEEALRACVLEYQARAAGPGHSGP